MKTTYIYGLIDPITNEIRYVGKTNDIQSRLQDHIRYAKNGQKNYKSNWIRKLLRQSLEPKIKILQEVPANDWQKYEKLWISKLIDLGIKLTNKTRGGDGFSGNHTKETKIKISKASLGRKVSEKTRRKLSENNAFRDIGFMTGKPFSEEHKNKIGLANTGEKNGMYGKVGPMAGRKHSQESIEKMRQSSIGQIAWNKGKKLTEEHKKNLKKNHKGFSGKSHSEETKRKMSEAKMGKKNPMYGKNKNGPS